jgi:hypothetical protein
MPQRFDLARQDKLTQNNAENGGYHGDCRLKSNRWLPESEKGNPG